LLFYSAVVVQQDFVCCRKDNALNKCKISRINETNTNIDLSYDDDYGLAAFMLVIVLQGAPISFVKNFATVAEIHNYF